MMNILRYPEKIPCDKRLHYIVGSIFTAILLSFTLSMFTVILSLFVFAWAIEFSQDIFKWGTYNNWDAVAVVAGRLIVILPIVIRGL